MGNGLHYPPTSEMTFIEVVNGFNTYEFSFVDEHGVPVGDTRFIGCAPEEIEMQMPEAVKVLPDGKKCVDYTMLGVGFRVARTE